MKAITVRQPWAWALIHGGKDVENRTRNLAGRHRGELAIHAGLTTDVWAETDDRIQAAFGTYDDSWLLQEQIERTGAFIGVVDLTWVHVQPADRRCPCSGEWADRIPGTVHLGVTRPRALAEPVAARGQLGMWETGPELEWAIREQLPQGPPVCEECGNDLALVGEKYCLDCLEAASRCPHPRHGDRVVSAVGSGCWHDSVLDRPESDTWECLDCGYEGTGPC